MELGIEEQDFSYANFGLTKEAKVVQKAEVLFKRLDMDEELNKLEEEAEKLIVKVLNKK